MLLFVMRRRDLILAAIACLMAAARLPITTSVVAVLCTREMKEFSEIKKIGVAIAEPCSMCWVATGSAVGRGRTTSTGFG